MGGWRVQPPNFLFGPTIFLKPAPPTNLTKYKTDDHAFTRKPTELFIYYDFLGEFFNALFTV